MGYFYDFDNKSYITIDELKTEYAEYAAKGYTEAESFDEYVYNCLDYSLIEITAKIYDEREKADTVRRDIADHIAADNASWGVEIAADGESWKLTLEGDPVCSIELDNVIPALDYLYSVINADSTEEEDIEAMLTMKSEWGF